MSRAIGVALVVCLAGCTRTEEKQTSATGGAEGQKVIGDVGYYPLPKT